MPRMNNNTTAPIVDTKILPIKLVSLMPKNPNRKFPIKPPTRPTTIFPTMPKPLPFLIMPANRPAIPPMMSEIIIPVNIRIEIRTLKCKYTIKYLHKSCQERFSIKYF